MAIQTRAYLYGKFENGDKPNQQDFADFIDSYWHKSESPGVSTTAASGSTTTVNIAAGTLVEKIVVIGSVSGTITISKNGTTTLFDAESFTTAGSVFEPSEYFNSAGTLVFTGYAGTPTFKIYYR